MEHSQQEPEASIRLHARRLVCENTVFSVFFDHVSGEGGHHDVPQYLDGRDTHQPVTNSELGHGKMHFFGRDEITALIASGGIEDACTLAVMFLHFAGPAGDRA